MGRLLRLIVLSAIINKYLVRNEMINFPVMYSPPTNKLSANNISANIMSYLCSILKQDHKVYLMQLMYLIIAKA